MTKSYYVYIIKNSKGILYTGITTDIARRLAQHNKGTGAKFTRGKGPWELEFSMALGSRSLASSLEAKVKAMSKKEKLALCQVIKPLIRIENINKIHGHRKT